jgi:hypothetical protein
MTFKETEFPGLIKFLKTFVNDEADPHLIKEVMLQFVKLYEDVPLYPGIVGMCMGQLVKKVDPRELNPSQKVFIRNQGDCYCGQVAKKDEDGVVLKAVKSVTSEDELEFGFKEMDQVTVVNQNVLQELWPSLVFEKEKAR